MTDFDNVLKIFVFVHFKLTCCASISIDLAFSHLYLTVYFVLTFI